MQSISVGSPYNFLQNDIYTLSKRTLLYKLDGKFETPRFVHFSRHCVCCCYCCFYVTVVCMCVYSMLKKNARVAKIRFFQFFK